MMWQRPGAGVGGQRVGMIGQQMQQQTNMQVAGMQQFQQQSRPPWQPLNTTPATATMTSPQAMGNKPGMAMGMRPAMAGSVGKGGCAGKPAGATQAPAARPVGAIAAVPKLAAESSKKATEEGKDSGKVQKSWNKKGGNWDPTWALMPLLMGMMGPGGKKGGSWGKSTVKPLPADHAEVDQITRFAGTVAKYIKNAGHGWVELKQKGVVPEDKVFVFHRNILSEDRFPCLKEGMDVELTLEVYTMKSAPGKKFVRAKQVTAPGGGSIAIQDQMDAESKTFVGSQNLRYSGTIKFYSMKRRFGYIQIDEGFAMPEPVPQEIKVEHAEVNCGGKEVPKNMKGVQCEFGIYKTEKGDFRAYNVTMPGSMPFTLDALDNRQYIGDKEYKGVVEMNKWSQGHGFIKLDASEKLPPYVTERVKEIAANEKNKNKQVDTEFIYFTRDDVRDDGFIKKTQAVLFKIYIDEQGLGAADIHPAA